MKKLIFGVVWLLLAVRCQAEIITVDDDGPANFNNIQAAIDDSNDGDIIIVQQGIYTGDGNRDIDFGGRAITVRSTDPNDPDIVVATVIDCNGTETEPHRGFNFHNGEDANSVLAGLTITNGYASYGGGAIYCNGSGPTIAYCTIMGNRATYGAGIFAGRSSNPIIANCTISGNTRPGIGGGYTGGGVYCWWNTTATVTSCVISSNDGAGVHCHHNSSTKMSDCEIIYNGYDGICYPSAAISNCTISNNGKEGIRCHTAATLSNCIISVNSSAGIKVSGGSPTIGNCTISGNNEGVHCSRGDTSMTNSIVWNNRGNDIYVWNFPLPPNGDPPEPTQLTVSYSCPGVIFVEEDPVCGDPILTLGEGNIDADPCFVAPGYWDVNGTPGDAGDDFWVDGDYHLKSEGWRWNVGTDEWIWDNVTSRCIDAGNPGCDPADEPLPNNSNRINMGAYGGTAEASIPPHNWALLADLTNDGLVNFEDYAGQAIDWSNSGDCQPGDLDRNSLIDIFDLALLVEDWLKQTTWHEP